MTILSCFSLDSISQDIIVTEKNEYIKCKIISIKRNYIVYQEEGASHGKFILRSDVKKYEFDYYEAEDDSTGLKADKKRMRGYFRTRLSIDASLSYLIAEVDPNLPEWQKNYIEKLKLGYSISSNFIFFINKHVGFGIQYSLFRSQNEMDSILFRFTNGTTRMGKMSDNIFLHYVSPVFCFRIIPRSGKTNIFIGASIGYLRLRNKAIVVDPLKITGNDVGVNSFFNIDFFVTEHLALGLGADFIVGSFGKLEYDYGYMKQNLDLEDNRENLSRIDISVGLRLHY